MTPDTDERNFSSIFNSDGEKTKLCYIIDIPSEQPDWTTQQAVLFCESCFAAPLLRQFNVLIFELIFL